MEQQLPDLETRFAPLAQALFITFAVVDVLADLDFGGQQGASQQATLQQAVLHFEASQQDDFGAARADEATRASTRLARMCLFMLIEKLRVVTRGYQRFVTGGARPRIGALGNFRGGEMSAPRTDVSDDKTRASVLTSRRGSSRMAVAMGRTESLVSAIGAGEFVAT
jgi:hypothetical protein